MMVRGTFKTRVKRLTRTLSGPTRTEFHRYENERSYKKRTIGIRNKGQSRDVFMIESFLRTGWWDGRSLRDRVDETR